MIDDVVTSAILSVLPDRVLIEVSGDDSPDLVLSYADRRARVSCRETGPLWTVLENGSGTVLSWGQEKSVGEAARAALACLLQRTPAHSGMRQAA